MMKRFITLAIAVLLVALMVVPAFAAEKSAGGLPTVSTKEDLPDPNDKDAEDRYFVEDEKEMYVRAEDYTGELKYFPEDEVPVKYDLIKKFDPWTKGKDGDALFAFDASVGKLKAVYIDNVLVDAANYTFSGDSDSTEVVFTKEFIATLALGEHKIVILSTDGFAKGTFKILEEGKTSPVTGDNSNTFMWVAIGLVSLGAIGVVAFALAKKRKSVEN